MIIPAASIRRRPVVIFSSYGNDTIALLQLAHEIGLSDVDVCYTDTGWAADGWNDRVDQMEAWARSLGFRTHRTSSVGFVGLARKKKAFPTQRYQWCSHVLKIEPGTRWLEEHDPLGLCCCLLGVRRAESEERRSFPLYAPASANHGGRDMWAPMAEFSEDDRNEVLARAGVEPLPHRSRECKCINANKLDMQRFTENDIRDIEAAEAEIGRPVYRPGRHLGATGIREVIKWSHSKRGQYRPPPGTPAVVPDDLPDENMLGCDAGWCGQ